MVVYFLFQIPLVHYWNIRNQLIFVYKHTSFYCSFICSASQIMHFFFFHIEGLRQLWIDQVCWHHFSNSISHLVSLCIILVIINIFHIFSLLSYLLWWSVIGDLWCYYYSLKPQILVSIFFLVIQKFWIKVCTFFFRHDAVVHNRLQYSVNITFYMHWETKEKCVTCFIMIFYLFWWSATKPTMSLMNACVNLVSFRLDIHDHLFLFSVFVLFWFLSILDFSLGLSCWNRQFYFFLPNLCTFYFILLSYYIS